MIKNNTNTIYININNMNLTRKETTVTEFVLEQKQEILWETVVQTHTVSVCLSGPWSLTVLIVIKDFVQRPILVS